MSKVYRFGIYSDLSLWFGRNVADVGLIVGDEVWRPQECRETHLLSLG